MSQSNKRKLPSDTNDPNKRAKYDFSPEGGYQPKTSIEDMPNEMLLKIFEYLERKDILSATLVKKSWNNLISNTQQTMEEIKTIYINKNNIEAGIPKFTRTYTNIHVKGVQQWNTELFKSLEKIGNGIESIGFDGCWFYDDAFKNLIKCFDNVQYMHISDSHSPVRNYSSERKIVLNKLELLCLKDHTWPLSLIQSPKLKFFAAKRLESSGQEFLINFLNEQTHLKCLNLDNIYKLFDSTFGKLEPNFRLDRLMLNDLPRLDKDQLMYMLNLMTSSISSLGIGFDVGRDITEYALKNFNNMQSLTVDCSSLPSSLRFYNELAANETLKKVEVTGDLEKSRTLLQFLKAYTGIESLTFYQVNNLPASRHSFWRKLSKYTPNVSYLMINSLGPSNINYIKSKKLKHFNIYFLEDIRISDWINFCKNNPSIECFHVCGKDEIVEEVDVETILSLHLPKLWCIKFFC